jgi:hypothetical protein
MAETNKFAGLLDQMGIMSPSDRATLKYNQQMAQLQFQQQQRLEAQRSGQMAARGGFGYPAYLMERAFNGGGGNMQMPTPPPQEDTSQVEGIMNQTLGGQVGAPQAGQVQTYGVGEGGSSTPAPMKKPSQSLIEAAQQILRLGGTENVKRAQMLYAKSLELQQQEAEEERKVAEAEIKQNEEARKRNPNNPFAVGVEGDPDMEQGAVYETDARGVVQYNPDGTPKIKKVGSPMAKYKGTQVTVDTGDMLTDSQRGNESIKFRDRVKNARTFVRTSQQYLGDIVKGGAGGITGEIVTKMSNAFDTAKYALRAFKPDSDYFSESNSQWESLAKNTALSKATIIGMAYTLAASHSEDGRISDADYKYAVQELGGNLSDASKARAVMLRAINNLKGTIDDSYVTLPDSVRNDVKGVYGDFSKDFDTAFPKDKLQEPGPGDEDELEALLNKYAPK